MCTWIKVSAETLEGAPILEIPGYYAEGDMFEETGCDYCTCWLDEPEGKPMRDYLTEQVLKPMFAALAGCVGRITIELT